MKIEQKIIVLVAKLLSFISYAYSNNEACPSSPCSEAKPKLGPNDTLELDLFFEQYEHGSQAVDDLSNNVCKLMKTCGKQISMNAIPGALVKETNGELSCPKNFCTGDEDQVCSALIDPEYATTCKETPSGNDVDECKETRKDEVKRILIENAKKRETLGIPECKVPTLTFNGVYDLCADISSYDSLLTYVCGLYENQLSCCNN